MVKNWLDYQSINLSFRINTFRKVFFQKSAAIKFAKYVSFIEYNILHNGKELSQCSRITQKHTFKEKWNVARYNCKNPLFNSTRDAIEPFFCSVQVKTVLWLFFGDSLWLSYFIMEIMFCPGESLNSTYICMYIVQ